MDIYLLEKEKNRKYVSKDICKEALNFDLQYDGEKPVGCSISDTKNYWICAIGECGIDIEENSRVVKPIALNPLHVDEQKYMSGLEYGTSEWTTEFLRIWTAKEAVFKLFGKKFKDESVLDQNLSYKKEIDGYKVIYVKGNHVTMTVLTKDAPIKVNKITYKGVPKNSCIDYAAELLTTKPYTSAELKKKLKQKGYIAEEIDATLEELSNLGYIDDAAYAKRYAQIAELKGNGINYIKSKLASKGISSNDMPEIDKDTQYDIAFGIAESIFEETEDYEATRKMMAKIARRLESKGFESSIIYRVLDNLK